MVLPSSSAFGSITRRNCICEFDWRSKDSKEASVLDLELNSHSLKARMEFRMISKRERSIGLNSGENMLHDFWKEDDDGSELSGMLPTLKITRNMYGIAYGDNQSRF
jgi:hypothetical protein